MNEQIYQVADLMNDCEYFSDADRVAIAECGDWLTFVKNSVEAEEYRLHSANFCRKRFCPMCQWRKAERQFSNCLKLSEALRAEEYRFLHLTLTIPNCNGGVELVQAVKHLYNSFSKFIKYNDVKKAFKGCMRALELSYNYDTHTFHPHLHCLIAVNASYFNDSRVYLSYAKIRLLWSKACKSDELLQVAIRAIKENDPLGYAEVSKYCLKPLELKEGNLTENQYILYSLAYTLKGTRFLQSYGVIKDKMRELKLTDEDNEDDPKTDHEQMFVYHWNCHQHRYEAVTI